MVEPSPLTHAVRRVMRVLALLVAVPMVLVGATAGPASAHVLKTVGPYHLLIGFGDEPTFAGSQNSVFLLLTNAKTGAPIVDESLGDTLKVEVRFGTRHMQLPLVSSYDPDSGGGTKGVYNAYFIPTVPGDYTFHLYGTIDKQKVDVSVKSSSTTFDSAHDPATIQFPQRAPSNVQLAQRLKAESARMSARTHAASKESGSASTSAALAVGIAGLVVGAAGLCVGGLALTRSRSRRPAAGEPQSPRVE